MVRLTAFSPSCKEATRLLSAALDCKLPWHQRFGLRVHLMLCQWCRRYGRQITFLNNAAQANPDKIAASAPQPLSMEAKERIRQKMRADQQ